MNNGDPGLIGWIVILAIILVEVVGIWKVYAKAGKPGWACLIPIYNVIVLLQIAGRPLWWTILYFIPIVNFVTHIVVSVSLARSFGKGAGFGVGVALLGFIFMPVLGYGEAQYGGPVG